MTSARPYQPDVLTGQITHGLPQAMQPVSGPQPHPAPGNGGLQYSAAAEPGRLFQEHGTGCWTICVGAPHGSGDPDNRKRLRQLSPGNHMALQGMGGEYALLCYEPREQALLLATDCFGSIPIYYANRGPHLSFGTDFRWVAARERTGSGINRQALYDYLFFSMVPGSRSVLEGIHKLPPASVLIFRDGRLRLERYWLPDFDRPVADARDLEEQTLDAISGAVARLSGMSHTGCFLSGGLDSSTVCGFAARHGRERVPVFTIGFDVPDYDESRYARISARHFGLDLHEKSIRSTDVAACLDRVLGAFPEPFGNASALSAYLCAEFARDAGISHMLAGDGGDELFAGNERYQKQAVFNIYDGLPGWLRHGALDPLAGAGRSATGPLRKLASYVEQARIPLPDRLFSYNLLVRNDPLTVLTPEFLAAVNPEAPYEYARQVYRQPGSGDALDRMLYLDWALTLTDNDLPKVYRTAGLAGVSVHFPMLDPEVVRISTRVPSQSKLSLKVLRKFYKKAFAGFLPREIIRKPKHGFGVPVGLWINTDAGLRERVYSRLQSLGRRGIVQKPFIEELLRLQQTEHAIYYGALMWSLFMLEEWLSSHAP